MPLRKSANAIKAKIEQGQQEQLAQGVPAAALRDQVLPRNLGPRGDTAQGYSPADHDHTAAGDGGTLSAPVVDSYVVLEEVAAPSAPAANTARLYAKDAAGVTELYYKNSAGTELDLSGAAALADQGNVTYLDFTNASAPATPASGKTRIYTKTDKSFYQKDDAGAETSLGGSSGGTSAGAVGSEPGSPAAGDLYLETNGLAVERYSGSVWARWGPIWPLTAPISGDLAWINQGSATIATTNGGIHIANLVSTATIAARVKSAPSTPYTIDAAFLFLGGLGTTAHAGVCWREAGTGEVITHGLWHNSGEIQYYLTKWDSPTVFNAHYLSVPTATALIASGIVWFRLSDDGTDRKVYYSVDGYNWSLIHSVGRTDFLTADQVGFYAASNGAGSLAANGAAITLLHWKEA